MIVVPFKAEHLDRFQHQDAELINFDFMTETDFKLWETGDAYTAIEGDEVLCCAGVHRLWPGRGVAWACLSKKAGKHMAAITRAVKRGLDLFEYDRIEAVVSSEFPQGHRWIRMLGFELETPKGMDKYFPNGDSAMLYARVK